MGMVQVLVVGQDAEEATGHYTDFLPRKGEIVQLPGPKLARVAEVMHSLWTQKPPAVVVPLLIVNLIDEETCSAAQNK